MSLRLLTITQLLFIGSLFLPIPAVHAGVDAEAVTAPSDAGLPEQNREALRELVEQGSAKPARELDRRPGILGPATSFPTGENAAYYMDEVKLQPSEPETRASEHDIDDAQVSGDSK